MLYVYAANYTIPVSNILTFSVGGNYGDARNNQLENRYGYEMNMSFRVMNQHNLSLFVSRNRDEFKNWNDVAYLFMTFTIPESNNFISALYDQKQKSGRINILRDNQNKLYEVRSQALVEAGETRRNGELDLTYPTPVGDFGGRLAGLHTNDDSPKGRGSLRLNSALVFAYHDNEVGMGISRPIPGSFVLFKPEKSLKDQKIGLKSTSPFTEAETGLFDEIVFSNLVAYQYRDVQLDSTFLDVGRTLQKEQFMLYPTYRSGHLIKLQERGSVILTGKLTGSNGAPLGLQVGRIGQTVFFTNREGAIFVEGLEPGTHLLEIENYDDKINITISQDERGFKDLGIIQIQENEL